MNYRCSFIETLKYSKAHDMWASEAEFDHLHRLLTQKKDSYTPPTQLTQPLKTQSTPQTTTGVRSGTGPRTSEKTNYYNHNQRDPHQTEYRKKVDELLKKQPHNRFFISLDGWRSNYTPKQAAAIERAHIDIFKSTPSSSIKKDIDRLDEKWMTEDEENDPNWTPW